MNAKLLLRTMILATFVAGSAALISSCGGGSGGAGGDAQLLTITIDGVTAPLFTNGQPPQPQCPIGAFLNARVTFKFSGPVDPTSLPPNGPATGSIQIVATGAIASPAVGNWLVSATDPSTVFFLPLPPQNPSAGCEAGLLSATTYSILVPDGSGGSQQVVRVGGSALTTSAGACFTTVTCNPFDPGPSLTDPFPGPPIVESTIPLADPTSPMTTLAAVAGDPGTSIVTIDINEAIQPQTATLANIQVVNVSSNPDPMVVIPVPGTLTFMQAGTVPGFAGTRIIFTTSAEFTDGDTFEIRANGIQDLGGNSLAIAPGELAFSIEDLMDDVDQIFSDDFTTTTNLGSIIGAISWTGNGEVSATFPESIVGQGTLGAGNLTTSMTFNSDTMSGAFDYTSLSVGTGVTLDFTAAANDPALMPGQSFAVNLRSQTTITFATMSSSTLR